MANVAIDDDLLARALDASNEKSKTATVNQALHEFIRRREQRRILDLFGTLDWDSDFDYKRARNRP